MSDAATHVIVGVIPGQPDALVRTAATFAEHFDADLVCAYVDNSHYAAGHRPDGTVVTMPIDPDLVDDEEGFDPDLFAALADLLEGRSVRWTVRYLVGGPAQELGRLADELNAAMIVVGTREAGVKRSLHEFFNGSVAVQLAHRQHRPVVVVPLDPVPDDGVLPWQTGADASD